MTTDKKTTGLDWEAIVRELDGMQWEEVDDRWEKTVFIGTVFSLYPSGKYYMPWACSNVTEEEAQQDEEFRELLEAEADEHGLFVTSGEGDPCDVFVGKSIDPPDFQEFWEGYLLGLAFTAQRQEEEDGDSEPLFSNPGGDIADVVDLEEFAAMIDPQELQGLREDCEGFLREAVELLGDGELSDAGGDFHLTRNRHGAGFWDGDWEHGKRLTEIAHVYGSAEVYVFGDSVQIVN